MADRLTDLEATVGYFIQNASIVYWGNPDEPLDARSDAKDALAGLVEIARDQARIIEDARALCSRPPGVCVPLTEDRRVRQIDIGLASLDRRTAPPVQEPAYPVPGDAN